MKAVGVFAFGPEINASTCSIIQYRGLGLDTADIVRGGMFR
jgi:hypothetical protein